MQEQRGKRCKQHLRGYEQPYTFCRGARCFEDTEDESPRVGGIDLREGFRCVAWLEIAGQGRGVVWL